MGTTYLDLFAGNVRAARARADLRLRDVSDRMNRLGFPNWNDSKVSKVERGTTPATAGELLALAVSLETTLAELLGASLSAGEIEFPTGEAVGAVSVRNSALGMQDHAVTWHGASPSITRPATPYSAQAWDRTLMSA